MLAKMRYSQEFVAALDQSGGNNPSALTQFGVQQKKSHLHRGFLHTMRARIISSTAFYSQRLVAANLFKDTLNSNIEGIPSVDYLWLSKWIVAFLKIDDGLSSLLDRVQLMRPMKDLYSTLRGANRKMNLWY
jgi:fructose-bisphosphate aldolase class I